MEFLGVKEFDERRHRCCCPVHNEDTPSFIYDSARYTCHCFGCGINIDFIDAYMRGFNATFAEAVQKLFDVAGVQYSFGEIGVKSKRQYKYPKPVECTDKTKVYAYLAKRHISPATADFLDIREDQNGNLVFNYYDLNDTLTTVKYRPSHKIQKGESKNWSQPGADTTPLLYNMNRVNPKQPLLITSGELDCAAAIEAGYSNATSIPFGDQNDHWVSECWDFLEQFDEIIVCADNDESGQKFKRNITPRLGEWRCKIVDVPEYYETPSGTKVKVKDLNEVLVRFGRQKVLDIIVNAKQSEVPEVVDYCDVEDFDMENVDGIYTSLPSVDGLVQKLYFGSTVILTGITGSGKSSFISQIIGQALDQHYNAFIYSGELENPMLKSWIDAVLAGQRNIGCTSTQRGVSYHVSQEAKDAMRAFYKKRLYIYRDDFSQAANKMLSVMETMVRRNNVKLCVIDNMTSIDLECTDANKYFKQDEFIRKVIEFSKKFKCLCVVVLHPKKMDAMRRMSLFDLQGVVTSVNLAHMVFALYRVQDSDRKSVDVKTGKPKEPIKFDVLMDCLKNRFGPGAGKTAGLYYDTPSRRFFEDEKTLDYQYEWDKNDYSGKALPYPPQQLIEEELEEEECFGEIS